MAIALPELETDYLAKCDNGEASPDPHVAYYRFRLVSADTLRIEYWQNERLSWIEKRVVDHGIDISQRSAIIGLGHRIQRHELSGLEDVRMLRPRARAEGMVYEREAGNWFEYKVVIEVMDEILINHPSRGERYVIPLRTSRTWIGGGRTMHYTSYVDAQSKEIIGFNGRSGLSWPFRCHFVGP